MGGQKGIALFYEYLSQRFPVTLISTRNNEAPHFPVDFIGLLSNHASRYINLGLLKPISKLLRELKKTHLILEHPYFGWLGYLIKISTKIQLVIHSHNIEAIRFKSTGHRWWRILWYYEKWVYQMADTLFFISEEDRLFAIQNFKLNTTKCHTITYGTVRAKTPEPAQRLNAETFLREKFHLRADERILLFNGTLDYKPNLDAVERILNLIEPELASKATFKFKIIICGKGLPEYLQNQLNKKQSNIIYAGFVDQIDPYFLGADLFINPVLDGGGIKTKLVEALGQQLTCVSTYSGALGIPVDITGEKLLLSEDTNWTDFINNITRANPESILPDAFFKHFYWGNIAEKVEVILSKEQK